MICVALIIVPPAMSHYRHLRHFALTLAAVVVFDMTLLTYAYIAFFCLLAGLATLHLAYVILKNKCARECPELFPNMVPAKAQLSSGVIEFETGLRHRTGGVAQITRSPDLPSPWTDRSKTGIGYMPSAAKSFSTAALIWNSASCRWKPCGRLT